MHKYYMTKDGKTFKRLPKNSSGDFTVPEGVEVIAKRAFAGCAGLTGITLPSSLKIIGEEAFEGCNKLVSVSIPCGVEIICKGAFSNCTSIEEVILPVTLKELGQNTFYWCTSLKSVMLPEGIMFIPDKCFFGCGITEMDFPESLEKIGVMAFALCKIKSVVIDQNITCLDKHAFDWNMTETIHIGSAVRFIGDDALGGGCIKTITVDHENEVFTDAGSNVLMEKLTGRILLGGVNSTIPDSAKVISKNAFSTDSAPKTMFVPSSVETIETGAFSGFGEMIIVLNKGVRTIEECAFMPLKEGRITVYIPSTVTTMGAQCSSVDFHLDAANQSFFYDRTGKNIISNNGDLVWGRLENGIPSEGVINVNVLLDINPGYKELAVPNTVNTISRYIFGHTRTRFKVEGIKKLILHKGTKIEGITSGWITPFEVDLIIHRKTGAGSLLKNTRYTIPEGTPKEEIEEFLGNDSIFI